MIEEEAEGAGEYAKEAVRLKDENPALARMFYELANDELGHVGRLHEAVVRLIKEWRAEHGDPPEAMMAVYDYLHEKQIAKTAEARATLAGFNA